VRSNVRCTAGTAGTAGSSITKTGNHVVTESAGVDVCAHNKTQGNITAPA
jgi:hypothetical protein